MVVYHTAYDFQYTSCGPTSAKVAHAPLCGWYACTENARTRNHRRGPSFEAVFYQKCSMLKENELCMWSPGGISAHCGKVGLATAGLWHY